MDSAEPFKSGGGLRRLGSCLGTTNGGKPNATTAGKIHWHRAVISVFVAFYVPYKLPMLKEES